MRPTIPLAEWRLAVDRAATHALTTDAQFPARGCRCDDCGRWAIVYRDALPPDLVRQLERVGVDPAHPSDVYTLEDDGTHRILRVTFHAIGRILSGPAEWTPTGDQPAGRNYVVPYASSRYPLGLAVGYLETFQSLPAWAAPAGQPLLAIELWLRLSSKVTPSEGSARKAGV